MVCFAPTPIQARERGSTSTISEILCSLTYKDEQFHSHCLKHKMSMNTGVLIFLSWQACTRCLEPCATISGFHGNQQCGSRNVACVFPSVLGPPRSFSVSFQVTMYRNALAAVWGYSQCLARLFFFPSHGNVNCSSSRQ